MPGGSVIAATADTGRVEAPVTIKAYMMCAFAAFGGVCIALFYFPSLAWSGGAMAVSTVSTLATVLFLLLLYFYCLLSIY